MVFSIPNLSNKPQFLTTNSNPLSQTNAPIQKKNSLTDVIWKGPSPPLQILILLTTDLKLLQKLNPSKAAGPDNIRPRVAPILKIIFCRSLETGEVPIDWRSANVSPVFNKGIVIKQRITDQFRLYAYAAK